MFSEKDLVFPMPNGRGEEYLTEVLQHRSDHLKTMAGATDPIGNTYNEYLSLIKEGAPIAEIEGVAQLIRCMEELPEEKRESYLRNEPVYLNGQFVTIGTLYLNGKPSESPQNNQGKSFKGMTISDKVEGKGLQFIALKIGNTQLLISNKNLVYGVSWDDLSELGLIFGKPVKVDGQDYLLRTLTGSKIGTINCEWNTMMSVIGDSDDIWHWNSGYSWCQGAVGDHAQVLRGFLSAEAWTRSNSRNQNLTYGWRPVLELV